MPVRYDETAERDLVDLVVRVRVVRNAAASRRSTSFPLTRVEHPLEVTCGQAMRQAADSSHHTYLP
ncbi:hypothetical protein ADK41_25470 [Streptomyces caelestis]|uniref:Uncharacterized protein n=1 Tax=Streptomyces caelestis TaxID=36816 RepID=A0A0M8QMP2_9ACTN|nr:hypothetical protein ADK41_25470 [Streptomyces caelestis]